MQRASVARRAVAVAIGIAALGGACGGGADRLSASAYRSKASTQCSRLKDASDELAKAQAPGATGATVTKFLHGAADGLRDLVEGLDGLEPPGALQAAPDDIAHLFADH